MDSLTDANSTSPQKRQPKTPNPQINPKNPNDSIRSPRRMNKLKTEIKQAKTTKTGRHNYTTIEWRRSKPLRERAGQQTKMRKQQIEIYKKFNKHINKWKPNTNKEIGTSAGNQRLRIITMNIDDLRSLGKGKKQFTG